MKSSKPKILLIDPPAPTKGLNVGLGFLTEGLKRKGAKPYVFDMNNNTQNDRQRLMEKIKFVKPDAIGFSIHYNSILQAHELARSLKKFKNQ
ncbi:MAG: hypothetical protein ABIL02_00485 [candidate division WOR-3 bacterium]